MPGQQRRRSLAEATVRREHAAALALLRKHQYDAVEFIDYDDTVQICIGCDAGRNDRHGFLR